MRALVFENILRQPVGWFDFEASSPGILVNRLARNIPLIKAVCIKHHLVCRRIFNYQHNFISNSCVAGSRGTNWPSFVRNHHYNCSFQHSLFEWMEIIADYSHMCSYNLIRVVQTSSSSEEKSDERCSVDGPCWKGELQCLDILD